VHDDPQRPAASRIPSPVVPSISNPSSPPAAEKSGAARTHPRRAVRPPRAAASPPPPRLEAKAIEIETKSLDEVVDLVHQSLQAGVLAI
jgi:hypothetical protein